jgi:ferric-dicitrate binding protein FerR (iron transport regulator)
MTKKNDQQESIAEISRQAAVIWLLLKDEPRLSLDDAWRILMWMLRSRRHVHELLLMRRQDARLTRLMRVGGETSKVVHVDWWQGSSSEPAQPQRRSYRAGWGIAAMVLLMLSVVLFIAPRSDESPRDAVGAATKELTTQRLEDGSLVSLDALASMRIDFTEKQRGVHLFHGQSLFDVAAGHERPFVVHTFLVDITAVVESKFAVRIDTSVEVEVFEGVVEVSGRRAKAGSPVIVVRKGEKYRVPVDTFRAIVADGSDSLRAALIR